MKCAERPTSWQPSWSNDYPWLKQSSTSKDKAQCTACNKEIVISSGVTTLKSHEASATHKKNILITTKQPNIPSEPATSRRRFKRNGHKSPKCNLLRRRSQSQKVTVTVTIGHSQSQSHLDHTRKRWQYLSLKNRYYTEHIYKKQLYFNE